MDRMCVVAVVVNTDIYVVDDVVDDAATVIGSL